MIIVSQDRKSIYNFNNIKSIDVLDNEVFITDDILADKGTLIGIYATEERAKEILQEIARFYKMVEGMKIKAGIKISIGVTEQTEKDEQDLHIYTLPEE